jgi:very-short-patch-repair endonuclease
VGGSNSSKRQADNRIPRARKLRRDVTEAEKKLWRVLRIVPMGGSHFRRQAPIGPYFADFACHTQRIVIELDGGQHEEATQAKRDGNRDEYMKANGYRVLRFWNNDVMKNLDGVLQVIVEAFSALTPPTPDPSPPLASLAGGGEKTRRVRRDA